MSELKRCPFCGGEAKLMRFPKCERKYVVICENEQCMASVGNYSQSKEKAIEAWNTRKPMERIVEQLEECYERYEDLEYNEHLENGQSLDFEYCHGKKDGVNESIEIVIEEDGMNE